MLCVCAVEDAFEVDSEPDVLDPDPPVAPVVLLFTLVLESPPPAPSVFSEACTPACRG